MSPEVVPRGWRESREITRRQLLQQLAATGAGIAGLALLGERGADAAATWSAWANHGRPPGTTFVTLPAIGRNQDGRMELVALALNASPPAVGEAWHIWQGVPNGPFSGWAKLGNPPGRPTAVASFVSFPSIGQNLDGRLEVFALAFGGVLWHVWQVAPNDGWSGWLPFSNAVTLKEEPAVGRNADGRMELIAWGADGALYHMWQGAPNSPFSDWAPFGGPAHSVPVVGQNADGRLEVFAVGADDVLWHRWQVAPNDGWSNWAPFGSSVKLKREPAVGRNADGRMELFAQGMDEALYHMYQGAPNAPFLDWAPFGGAAHSGPTVAQNADGRLEVFALGTDGALWHRAQTAPNDGWDSWASLGVPPGTKLVGKRAQVGQNQDGRLEVFAVSGENDLWHIWQT